MFLLPVPSHAVAKTPASSAGAPAQNPFGRAGQRAKAKSGKKESSHSAPRRCALPSSRSSNKWMSKADPFAGPST